MSRHSGKHYITVWSGNVGRTWQKFVFSKLGHLRNSVNPDEDNRPRYIVGGDNPPLESDGIVGAVMTPNENNTFSEGQIVWVRSGQGLSLITQMEIEE